MRMPEKMSQGKRKAVQDFFIKIIISNTNMVIMSSLYAIVADAKLLKEFKVINLLNHPIVACIVVFTPILSAASTAAC